MNRCSFRARTGCVHGALFGIRGHAATNATVPHHGGQILSRRFAPSFPSHDRHVVSGFVVSYEQDRFTIQSEVKQGDVFVTHPSTCWSIRCIDPRRIGFDAINLYGQHIYRLPVRSAFVGNGCGVAQRLQRVEQPRETIANQQQPLVIIAVIL